MAAFSYRSKKETEVYRKSNGVCVGIDWCLHSSVKIVGFIVVINTF